MGTDSEISWCHDTINPWIGCAAVSPACKHCYAESYANRFSVAEWGPNGTRKLRVEKAIAELHSAARRAQRTGEPRRVFVASLSDFFENRADLIEPRKRFWEALHAVAGDAPVRLADGRRAVAVLLLTKRPDIMAAWADERGWPEGCWAGTTVEDQQRADERVPALLRVPAAVRFLSCEPLLGPVRLDFREPPIAWVIAGGESGAKARPSHPDWFRSLRDRCSEARVSFHFKQWGEFAPEDRPDVLAQYAQDSGGTTAGMVRRVGKAAAGRLLDGAIHDAVPQVGT